MDLSQQELPLTVYFTRGKKDPRAHAVSYRKDEPTADSQSVARSSKKSSASPQSSASKSKSRMTSLQLPTPATSTRKRMRNGHLKLPVKPPLTSSDALLSPVQRNAISPSQEDLAELEPALKLPRFFREGISDDIPELSQTPLATRASGRRKTTKSTDVEFHIGFRPSTHGETGIPTPRTLSRRMPQPLHAVDDHSPLASSNHRLPFKPNQSSSGPSDSGVSREVLHTACSTGGLPSFPVDLDCPDPFYDHEKNDATPQRHGTFALSRKYTIQSKTLDAQSFSDHAMHAIPVSSSQSQYLLHLDATPKRKRYSRQIERVISSQTQEERELTLSTPHRPVRMNSFAGCVSPGKYPRGHVQISRLGCSKQEGSCVYAPGPISAGSPVNSPAGRSYSSLATKKAPNELSPKFLRLPRDEKTTSCPSPRQENILVAHTDDSQTESESESDIPRAVVMKDKLPSCSLPSREMNVIPRHSPVARDAHPPVCYESAEGNLAGEGDDNSATEAESDTEILHCVAEIGKKRLRSHHSELFVSPHRVISPLVSPARSRVAITPPMIISAQLHTQESSVSASYPSTIERPQTLSESLPSAVRDFIRMFPGDGDESYPADFPASLRV